MDMSSQVVRYLTEGVTVDLVGRAGSGRSEVLRLVGEALEHEHRHVIHMRGVRAQRDRALGAVLLGAKNLTSASYSTIREFAGALEREVRPATVILVDDADDLDTASIGALASVHATTGVAMLVTRRFPYEPLGNVKALVTGLQPGVRIAMASLRFDQVHQLVRTLLGAHVEPLTVARIATKAGGLPSLVRAIVGIGRRTGAIAQLDGVWVATRPLWAPELSHTVGALLAHAEQRDVEALAELADKGVVDLGRAVELIGGSRLAALQRAGFVEVLSTPDGGQVSLFPPLLSEYFTNEYTSSRDLESGIPYIVAPDSVGTAEIGRRALPSDDPIMSRVLAEHWSHETHIRRARWEADPAADTAIQLLSAMLVAGTHRGAVDEIYYDIRRGVGSTPEERAELTGWYAVYLAVGCDEPVEAFEILKSAGDSESSMSEYFLAVEAHLRLVLDRLPAELATNARAAVDDGIGAQAHAGVQIELALARGSVEDALRMLEPYSPTYPGFRRHRDVCWGLGLVLHGRLDDGVRWALENLATAQSARDAGGIVAHSYVAGLGLAISGRLAEMDEVLSAVMTLTTVAVLEEHFHAGAFAIAALGSVWQGKADYAAMLAHEAENLWHRPGPYPVMQAGAMLAEPSAAGSSAATWAMVDDRMARGYVAAGVFAAVDAVERDWSTGTQREPRSWAQAAQSPLLDTCVRYVESIAERDRAGIEEAATSFESLGALAYVVRARISLARITRDEGDLAAALAEVDHAWEIAKRFGTSVGGLFAPYVTAVDISAREAEVVSLLATGLNAADIATALTVSVRTVENHLFNVYRKVGLDSRTELRRVAATWLEPALRRTP